MSGRVEFFVGCSDLTNKHGFVGVYLRDATTNKWLELGKTEVGFNSNPYYMKQFIVDFIFQEEQQLRFDVYKSANNTTAYIHKNVIGSAAFKLSEIINAKSQLLTRTLTKGRKVVKNRATKRYARINVRLEQLGTEFNDNTTFEFAATDLPKIAAKKRNPILEFHRLGRDGKFFKIYETEICKKTLAPNWSPFTITSTKLCNNDGDRNLQLKIFNVENKSEARFYVAKCQTTYNKLVNEQNKIYPLKNGKGQVVANLCLQNVKILSRQQNTVNNNSSAPQSNKYSNAKGGGRGRNKAMAMPNKNKRKMLNQPDLDTDIQHQEIRRLQEMKSNRSEGRFLSYLQGSCEISLMVAIDFTGSNGYVNEKQSLHYIYNKNKPSPYQDALRQICSVVAPYDSDQKFPVWGFGAKFPGKDSVIHDFAVSPNGEEVDGVSGIEQTYLKAIQSGAFQLSGPCCYSPILTKAINETIIAHNDVIKDPTAPIQYYILLILTNGQCCEADKQPTKNLLIYASNNNLPLSIIFVGIGGAKVDFKFLNELDGDFDPIKDDKGHIAKRDIVQFVPMRKFKGKPRNELNKYTLREVPIQFVSYADNNHISVRKEKPKFLQRTESRFFEEDNMDEHGYVHTKGNTQFSVSSDFDPDDLSEDEEEPGGGSNDNDSKTSEDDMSSAPVPVGWERSFTPTGKAFYINHKTRSTQWVHPLKKEMELKKPNQSKQAVKQAAYNVHLMNSTFDPNKKKDVSFAAIQRSSTYHKAQQSQPQQPTSPIARSQTFQQAQPQYNPQYASSPKVVYQKPVSPQAQPQYNPQYARQQQPQYKQPQQRVVYQQPAQPKVVYQQPQQPQQKIAYDQYGRQIVLPQQPRVVYQQQPVQPQRVVYQQPQYGQPQQRVVYQQQPQVVYQQQQPPQQQVVYQQPGGQRVVYQQPQYQKKW